MRRLSQTVILIALCATAALPSEAEAMHIADGILPLSWCALWYAISAPFLALGLWQLARISKKELFYKPLAGLVSAVVFVISSMPVPVPVVGSVSHPAGTGMSAILLGPLVTVVVATVSLILQALMMGHGGLSTLGANVLSMGICGTLGGYLAFRLLQRLGLSLTASAFGAGLLADWATYAATSMELALALHGSEPVLKVFLGFLVAFMPTQLPLGIIEGFITAGMCALLQNKRPDILKKLGVIPSPKAEA